MPLPVISVNPGPAVRYDPSGASGVLVFSATGAGSTIAWSAPEGSFSVPTTGNGQPTNYSPVNQTDAVTVTARDTLDNAIATLTIQVYATCPDRGQFGNAPVELDDRTNVSLAEDGGPSFLVKGAPFKLFQYQFPNRTQAQYLAMEAFWLWHRKMRKFYLEDPVVDGLFRLVRFDSKLQIDVQGADMIAYAATFREAVPA
jgi:hypothetical protein